MGGSLSLVSLKLYVNLQVTRLLNKSVDGVSLSSSPLGWHFFMCLSWNYSGINLEGKDKKTLACLWFLQMWCVTTSSVFLLAEYLCRTSFLLVSDSLPHSNPYANKHDYEHSLDLLDSPSHLDWVWQAEEGMDIMDSTNFNETNLSYGLTFWNSPCEWQCQQSPLPKLSREGPCNDGGN